MNPYSSLLKHWACIGITFCSLMVTGYQNNGLDIAKASVKTSSNIDVDVLKDDGSSTIEAQDYEAWTKPITSYLVNTQKGLMGVRYIAQKSSDGEGKIVVSYYDNDFHIIERKEIPSELPIWGGFGASSNFYYIVTGQNNENESATTEVIRITKYDKNWKRISSVSAKDCNVYKPFDFATVRMDFYNQYLIIKTGRLIYQTSDGLHHQVHLTLEVDTENMTLVNSETDYGYASHSLNQFIKADDDKIISVEQGDAYPRGIILFESNNLLNKNLSEDILQNSDKIKTTTILEVPKDDDYYQNLRASVGGLEISDSNYLIAGNSVIQDEKRTERTTRNIFVISMNKTTNKLETNWLTTYKEGEKTVSTPQMVKISDHNFMILWSRNDTVYYTLIDNEGKQKGKIYQHSGHLSDCQPILVNKKICWYTVDGIDIDFYTISVSDLSDFAVKETISGHQYATKDINAGKASLSCSVCGNEEKMEVLTSYSTWWNTIGTYERYSGGLPNKSLKLNIKDKIYFWITFDKENANTQIEIEISNPNIVSYTETSKNMGYFTALSNGSTKVTIFPKWNPSLKKEFEIQIGKISNTDAKEEKELTLTGVSLSSVTDNKNGKMTVKWKKDSSVSGYEIQYSTNKNFNSGNKTVKISKNSTSSTVVSGLSHGKTYYIRIRTYQTVSDKKYYSDWSTSKKLKISFTPASVSLSSVRNNKSKQMTVKWEKNEKVSGYEIQYSTDKVFEETKKINIAKNITVSKTISDLSKGKTYYVRIRTYQTVADKKYYSEWSKVKSIKISK